MRTWVLIPHYCNEDLSADPSLLQWGLECWSLTIAMRTWVLIPHYCNEDLSADPSLLQWGLECWSLTIAMRTWMLIPHYHGVDIKWRFGQFLISFSPNPAVSPVCWGCRICQLHLFRWIRLITIYSMFLFWKYYYIIGTWTDLSSYLKQKIETNFWSQCFFTFTLR